MTAYRFCRTDDVPLLVRAHNACYAEPSGAPPITLEDFRRWRQELDVWCSSCMVAFEGSDPVGVLIAAKRAHASFIHRIGVRPEHRRRGHARHMLESLARKMAILEPRRLLAEVPDGNDAARRLFEACGYAAGDVLVDWVAAPIATPRPDAQATEVSWDELEAAGALDLFAARTWLREGASLRAIREHLRGLAFVSDLRIEAALLYRDRSEPATREVLALGSPGGNAEAVLLEALLAEARWHCSLPLRMARLHPQEAPRSTLAAAGLSPAAEHVTYSTEAMPG